MSNAPVGFRFNPTEEELVRYYLANRVAGYSQDLWRGIINEFDMYTEEPWELWARFYRPNLGGNNLVEAKSDKCIYLFTTLKKFASGGNGKRVNRRVGTSGGTWHGQNTKNVKAEGGFSWCERRFSYKNGKNKEHDGGWLMMEFCFHEDDSLVLCRIGKKPSRGEDDDEVDVNRSNVTVSRTTKKRMRSEVISVLDGSSSSTCMEGKKENIVAKRLRVEETGLLGLPTSIRIPIGFNGKSYGNIGSVGDVVSTEAGNSVEEGGTLIGEPDHEDNIDLFDLDNINIVVGDFDEIEEVMMATFPDYHDDINGGPITRMQEEDMVTNGLDNLNGFGPVFNASDSHIYYKEQDQGGIDEVGAMNMGIPYHHGPDFGASNQGINGSFPTTCMEGQNENILRKRMRVEENISSTISGPVVIESGLLEPTSIRVESDQEDHVEVVGPENNETGDMSHDEVGDGSKYATINRNTRMQEEVGADLGIDRLDDLKGLGALPDLFLGPDGSDLSTWSSLPNLDDVDAGDDQDPMTFSLADLGDLLKY